MNTFILFIKGLIIGIGKIIPGVSGAVLAIILNVYDKAVDSIVNIFKDFKNNISYLIKIGLGVLTGIIFFSRIINYTLSNYYTITMLFFIGLIIGGIPEILKEVEKKDYKYTIITFLIITIISLLGINNSYTLKNNYIDFVVFFLSGIIETLGTVIPGLSSTALLLIMGVYNLIINTISNITLFIINYHILIPFIIGIISSLIIVTKFISYFLNNHKKKTYSIILGLILSSIIILILKIFIYQISFINLLLGLIFMIIGIVISNILG